jgi:hypothetical protein
MKRNLILLSLCSIAVVYYMSATTAENAMTKALTKSTSASVFKDVKVRPIPQQDKAQVKPIPRADWMEQKLNLTFPEEKELSPEERANLVPRQDKEGRWVDAYGRRGG